MSTIRKDFKEEIWNEALELLELPFSFRLRDEGYEDIGTWQLTARS